MCRWKKQLKSWSETRCLVENVWLETAVHVLILPVCVVNILDHIHIPDIELSCWWQYCMFWVVYTSFFFTADLFITYVCRRCSTAAVMTSLCLWACCDLYGGLDYKTAHTHSCLFTWSDWPWLSLNDALECESCPSFPPSLQCPLCPLS